MMNNTIANEGEELGNVNNTTAVQDSDVLNAINANRYKLQQMKRILSYREDIETIWTYAPLVIIAFGLMGEMASLFHNITSMWLMSLPILQEYCNLIPY